MGVTGVSEGKGKQLMTASDTEEGHPGTASATQEKTSMESSREHVTRTRAVSPLRDQDGQKRLERGRRGKTPFSKTQQGLETDSLWERHSGNRKMQRSVRRSEKNEIK